MNPKISIIIPVYNVEKYIERYIYSVINQSYLGSLECLLIDDCSPDRSIDIAKKIISEYKGNIEFKLITHNTNKGVSAARNTGINEATGDYIYFLDSDDYIIPECIEMFIKTLSLWPNAELIQGGAISEMTFLDIENKNISIDNSDDKAWIKTTILKKIFTPFTVWNKLIKRSFLLNNKLYFYEGITHEDEMFNFYLSKYLSSIAFCKKNTYIYVHREGSIIMSSNNKNIESWKFILNNYINNIDDFCRVEQIQFIYKEILRNYVNCKTNNDKIDFLQLFDLLLKHCSIGGTLIIYLTKLIPFYILKKSRIYNIFKNNLSKFVF